MDIDDLVEMVNKFIGVDTLVRWVGSRLVENYGVSDISVKRLKDSVILVMKADEENLDKIEKELRSAVSGMGIGKRIEVKME